jgi:hypothetical protein
MVTLSPERKGELSRMVYERTGKRMMFYGRDQPEPRVQKVTVKLPPEAA